MRKRLSNIAFFFSLISIVVSGCDTSSALKPDFEKVFYKLYGLQGDQQGVDVKQLPDGSGYVILGNSDLTGFSDGLAEQNIFLVRTDVQGNEMYQSTFGSSYKDEAVAIEVLPSGNFLFVVNSSIDIFRINNK